MKASIVIDTRSKNKDGLHPISLRVCDKYAMYFGTGYYGNESTFKNGLFTKSEPNYARKNLHLQNILHSTERIIIQLEDSMTKIENKKLRELINTDVLGKEKKRKKKCFVDYLDEFISTKQKEGTRTVYTSTKNKILEYDKEATFETMDVKWLSDFERWMEKSGMKVNAYAINLRNIRAVFNYAINNEYTELYPFRKFKIKKEETRKRSLTVEQLRILINHQCEEWQERYRDIFVLMFCLIGINGADLLMAGKDAIKNGRIEYKRAKTGKLYSIKIEPEAMEIINKYKGKRYLLNIMDEYKDYKNFLHRMGIALKQIGTMDRAGRGGKKIRKSLFPNLSSYWSRHTWATLAYELDIPVDVISQALGHSNSHSTTMIYINMNLNKVDEANRKVLNYVFEKKTDITNLE